MQLHTKLKTSFIGTAVFLCSLLLVICACTSAADTNSNAIDIENTTAQTTTQARVVGDEDPTTNIKVAVIVEQDPHGIYWGVRDTITGKLVLDYKFQKIGDFRNGFAMCCKTENLD